MRRHFIAPPANDNRPPLALRQVAGPAAWLLAVATVAAGVAGALPLWLVVGATLRDLLAPVANPPAAALIWASRLTQAAALAVLVAATPDAGVEASMTIAGALTGVAAVTLVAIRLVPGCAATARRT